MLNVVACSPSDKDCDGWHPMDREATCEEQSGVPGAHMAWHHHDSVRIHREREARSMALEQAYVHDVYDKMAPFIAGTRHRVWSRVQQFIEELEPGSIVCDVGCGEGKYLDINVETFSVGVDRCQPLVTVAAANTSQQVLVCDNLRLPLRDECCDAAVSVAVIHHLATTERRVRALRELARVLRIGGKVIVSVWAMEQRARKFESQDVLVPWQRPVSDERVAEFEPASTTSDDDVLTYCAYTQTSDSDSSRNSNRLNMRKSVRRPRRIRALDPTMHHSSQSSSDLSSPSETCYSFVRRALQKLAGGKNDEAVSTRPWLTSGWPVQADNKSDKLEEVLASIGAHHLIELHIDDDLYGDLSNTPRRRNTLGCESPLSSRRDINLAAFKSHSVGSMWSLISASIKSSRKLLTRPECEQAIPLPSADAVRRANKSTNRPKSFAFDGASEKMVIKESALPSTAIESKGKRKSVTFSTHSLTLPREREELESISGKSKSDSVLNDCIGKNETPRSLLTTLQEHERSDSNESKPTLVRQQCLSDEDPQNCTNTQRSSSPSLPGILKQKSLNENLIYSERMAERDSIMKKMRKHKSLNDTNYPSEEKPTDNQKDGLFANYKRLKILKESLGKLSESIEQLSEGDSAGSSIKSGLAKLMRQITDVASSSDNTNLSKKENDKIFTQPPKPSPEVAVKSPYNDSTNMSKRSTPESGDMEPPFRSPSVSGAQMLNGNNDKRTLYKYCSRERKTSRDEGSDSSKENSFQSDTSLDSEESCISVIYIPKPEEGKERSRSVSSESSDEKSPKSPLGVVIPASPTRWSNQGNRHCTIKGNSKLGAQILYSNLHGRFQLMDPPGSKASNQVIRDRNALMTSMESKFVNSKLMNGSSSDKLLIRSNSLDSSSNRSVEEVTLQVKKENSQTGLILGRSNSLKWTPSLPEEPIEEDSTVHDTNHVPMEQPSIAAKHLCNVIKKKLIETGPVLPPSPMPTLPKRQQFFPKDKGIEATGGTGTEDSSANLDRKETNNSKTTGTVHSRVEDKSTAHTSGTSEQDFSLPAQHDMNPRTGVSSQLSTLVMDENIEIIRRPGVKGICNVHVMRKSLPKYLTFEVYNPETDDLDSESSCTSDSSSPSSACSMISLSSEWASTQDMLQPLTSQTTGESQDHCSETESLIDQVLEQSSVDRQSPAMESPRATISSPTPADIRTSLSPTATNRASLSPSPTNSNTRTSLPYVPTSSDVMKHYRSQCCPPVANSGVVGENSAALDVSDLSSKVSTSPRVSRRKFGILRPETMLLEQVVEENDAHAHISGGGVSPCGRFSLVSSISSASSLSTSEGCESWPRGSSSNSLGGSERALSPDLYSTAPSSDGEQSSLGASNRAQQSPVRRCDVTAQSPASQDGTVSSSSAVSAATAPISAAASVAAAGELASTDLCSSRCDSSDGSVRSERVGSQSSHHRYYHVFREGELDKLIERYVDSLHIISSYYDHANWCIVAEKVQVWTI